MSGSIFNIDGGNRVSAPVSVAVSSGTTRYPIGHYNSQSKIADGRLLLDLGTKEYSEFKVIRNASFEVELWNAYEGARARLFVFLSEDKEITVTLNPDADEPEKVVVNFNKQLGDYYIAELVIEVVESGNILYAVSAASQIAEHIQRVEADAIPQISQAQTGTYDANEAGEGRVDFAWYGDEERNPNFPEEFYDYVWDNTAYFKYYGLHLHTKSITRTAGAGNSAVSTVEQGATLYEVDLASDFLELEGLTRIGTYIRTKTIFTNADSEVTETWSVWKLATSGSATTDYTVSDSSLLASSVALANLYTDLKYKRLPKQLIVPYYGDEYDLDDAALGMALRLIVDEELTLNMPENATGANLFVLTERLGYYTLDEDSVYFKHQRAISFDSDKAIVDISERIGYVNEVDGTETWGAWKSISSSTGTSSVTLSDAIDSTETTVAASSYAVKLAYDAATAAATAAETAATAAETAATAAATAQTKADSAATAAATAQTTADNASTAAATAQTTAENAQSSANDAGTAAETAQATADSAVTAAATAQTSANAAGTAAATAQTTADGAATEALAAANAANAISVMTPLAALMVDVDALISGYALRGDQVMGNFAIEHLTDGMYYVDISALELFYAPIAFAQLVESVDPLHISVTNLGTSGFYLEFFDFNMDYYDPALFNLIIYAQS